MDLVEKIKKHLPIKVFLRKEVIKHLQKNGLKIQKDQLLEVIDAYDSGEIGGIVCVLTHKKEVLIFSLTHLTVDKNHPLLQDIVIYQDKRIHELKNQL